MNSTYRLLLRWYRTRLLRYRPIYDSAHAQALLAEIHQEVQPFLTHADEVVRYVAASRAHYVAQSRQRPLYSRMLLEFLCALMLVPALCYWWVRAPKTRLRQHGVQGIRLVHSRETFSVIHLPPDLEASRAHSFIPNERYMRSRDIQLLARAAWLSLRYLRVRFKDHHFSGQIQYWFKLAKETARLCPVLEAYDMPYIVVYAEFDCSISYQTLLCHRNGVSLYNVIHGDHLIGMQDPFFQVDRCYTWHPFYNELFISQYAKADFWLFANPNFSMTKEEASVVPRGVGVVMPHPIYSNSDAAYACELSSLAEALNTLALKRHVTLRPHPFYPEHYAKIRPMLSDAIALSDPHVEPVRTFITQHACVIGTYSAALIEAAMMGRKVIAFENDITRQIAQYHFFFSLDNVQLKSIASLIDVLG
jgi:hypothetical protein